MSRPAGSFNHFRVSLVSRRIVDRQYFLVSSIGFDCTDCVRLAKFFGEFDWVR